MADSFQRFQVFTGMGANITAYAGQSVEEIKSAQGINNVPKTVVESLSPRQLERTETFLALRRGEHHPADITLPIRPADNPYFVIPMRVRSRALLSKLGSAVFDELAEIIHSDTIDDSELMRRMEGSLKKVVAMKDYAAYLLSLQDYVIVRMQQKG